MAMAVSESGHGIFQIVTDLSSNEGEALLSVAMLGRISEEAGVPDHLHPRPDQQRRRIAGGW